MNVRIAPSLLAADLARLADEALAAERAGADMLHLDIMDGRFVPNLTFGPPVVAWLARHTKLPLDAHLMVEDPDPLLAPLAEAGVARVAVHVESCRHLHRTLAEIVRLGMEPGAALNPATSLSALDEALAWVRFVLVMSVDPGFSGQRFIDESVDKVRRLACRATEHGVEIAVDGGVDAHTAGPLAAAGATVLVAGSAVYAAEDRTAAVAALRTAAERGGNS